MSKNQGIEIFKQQFIQGKAVFNNDPEPLCYLTNEKIPNELNCHPFLLNKWQNFRKRREYQLKCYYEDDIIKKSGSIREFTQEIYDETRIIIELIVNNDFLAVKKKHYRIILLDAIKDFVNNYYSKLDINDRKEIDNANLVHYDPDFSKTYYENMILPVTNCLVFVKEDGSYFTAVPITKDCSFDLSRVKNTVATIETTVNAILNLLEPTQQNKKAVYTKLPSEPKYYQDRFVASSVEFGEYDEAHCDSHDVTDVAFSRIDVIRPNFLASTTHHYKKDDYVAKTNFLELNSSQIAVVKQYLIKHYNAFYTQEGELFSYITDNKNGKPTFKTGEIAGEDPDAINFDAVRIQGYYDSSKLHVGTLFLESEPNVKDTKATDLDLGPHKIIKPLIKSRNLNELLRTITAGNNHLFYVTKDKLMTISKDNESTTFSSIKTENFKQ